MPDVLPGEQFGWLDRVRREAEDQYLGSEAEIRMRDLVRLILDLTHSDLEVAFERSHPVGHKRRLSDMRKARSILEFQPMVSLKDGLVKTIEWYRNSEWMRA
jgi:nucleoside-diphosphate-sugar epimerase